MSDTEFDQLRKKKFKRLLLLILSATVIAIIVIAGILMFPNPAPPLG
jgi:hypothetical protein